MRFENLDCDLRLVLRSDSTSWLDGWMDGRIVAMNEIYEYMIYMIL